MVKEQPQHVAAVWVSSRNKQWGAIEPLCLRVDIRAVVNQQPNLLQVWDRPHQSRRTHRVGLVRIRPAFQQQRDALGVGEERREHQGRNAVVVRRVGAESTVNQSRHRSGIATFDRKLVGADSFMTAMIRQILASALIAQGRWVEGESVARLAYETNRKTIGDQHPYAKVAQLRVLIAQIYQRPDDPEPWRQLEILVDAGLESVAPEVLQTINLLTPIMLDQGRLDDAQTLLDLGSRFEALSLEFPRPEPFVTMVLRARLACLSGRHEQGVKLLREAETQAAKRLPEWKYFVAAQHAICDCEMKLDEHENVD